MRYKKGFTLVELSIVLVIIGLLIGGILVAQSMIETAKTQQYVRKLQQYEIAIRNFKTSYLSIPGDSNKFLPPGDNNSLTDGCSACAATCEAYQVWVHLSQAKMIKGNYIAFNPSCSGGTQNDIFELNTDISVPLFIEDNIISSSGYPTKKFGIVYNVTPASSYFYSLLPNTAAVAVDSKIDDGNTSAGHFTATYYDTILGPQDCASYFSSGNPGLIACGFFGARTDSNFISKNIYLN